MTSFIESSVVSIREISENNEGLFSTVDISHGSLLFKDRPVSWNLHYRENKFPHCESCGNTRIGSLRDHYFAFTKEFGLYQELSSEEIREIESLFEDLEAEKLIENRFQISLSSTTYPCEGNCGALYCSEECRSNAIADGHLFLCKAREHIEAVNERDPSGHHVLAYKISSKILKRSGKLVSESSFMMINLIVYFTFLYPPLNQIASLSVEDIAIASEDFFRNFHSEKFTKSIHFFRGGAEVDDAFFDSMLSPAYFSR
jgi:hypothetical protein